MFRRRSVNRRSKKTAVLRTHALVERLEDKRLLSGTNSVASEQQTITVLEDVASDDYSIQIEEIHRVNDEYWVLSRLSSPWLRRVQIFDEVSDSFLPTVTDSVTINGPRLPVRHFRIGGFGNYDSPVLQRILPTEVNSVRDFHAQLEGHSTELLYDGADPELKAWRESVREKLITEADGHYAELYGTETKSQWLIYCGTPFLDDALFRNGAEFDSASLYSSTNVQVDGVDEGDIVETDGDYLYILSGLELVIVKAVDDADEAPEVVSRTQLMYRPQDMFLHDGRLTTIGTDYQYSTYWDAVPFHDSILPSRTRTSVSVFDVSDPSRPFLTQESVVDGDYVDARAIGQDVYVVLNNQSGIPYLPSLSVVHHGTAEDGSLVYRYQTRDEYLRSLDEVIERSSPPSAYRRLPDGQLERLGWLDDSILEGNISSRDGTLTNILKFGTTRTEAGPADNVSVPVASGWSTKIYASHNAIYLLTNEYQQVESGGNFVIVDQGETLTRINKVSIIGEKMALEASGVLKGTVDSQFSVDEHDGYLRVATTTGNRWARNSLNHLFVLQQAGELLSVVGSVEGLAPTESIYSMRYDGDRAWMVTFRQVDPVYSFDLSDPTDPKVTGELKIPGYSDYLQLIDENHLLAVGRGVTDNRIGEVQVSLFNIADMANPTLLYRYSFEEGSSGHSQALFEHHAFNYLSDLGFLVIPFSDSGNRHQARMVTLRIDLQNGIERVGDVGSSDDVLRSVRIDKLLFGIASASVSVVDLRDPGTLLDVLNLKDEAEPVVDHAQLLENYLTRASDVVVGRFRNAERLADHVLLGTGDWNAQLERNGVSNIEYEFQIIDRATGEVWTTVKSVTPLVELLNSAEGQNADEVPAEISVQFRTRDKSLQNAAWSEWSEPRIISLGDEQPELVSTDSQPVGEFLLRWSEAIGRGVAEFGDSNQQTIPVFRPNPVRHYDVWVTDATTRQRILRKENVAGTSLDLSELPAGKYWVWLRAAFQDGEFGDWTAGKTVRVLGEKLKEISASVETIDASPVFEWQTVEDAAGFEVEVTSPDGTDMVYTASDILQARHELNRRLPAGTYSFRVRARLPRGVYTEWSDPVEFTIVDRPRLSTTDDGFVWDAPVDGIESFELWVNDALTGRRIHYDADSPITLVTDVAEGGTDIVGGFLKRAFGPGRYEAWVRANLRDGSTSDWSHKATLNLFADAIGLAEKATFFAEETQTISWTPAAGIDSYEIYVQKIGQVAAVFRESGITETSVTLADQLSLGKYKVWVRGALTAGGFTRWGRAMALSVTDRPQLTVTGNVVTWTPDDDADRYEIWINRIDGNRRLLQARYIHLTDLERPEFELQNIDDGIYSVWVRSLRDTSNGVVPSAWSQRVNVRVERPDINSFVFAQEPLVDLLAALDQI